MRTRYKCLIIDGNNILWRHLSVMTDPDAAVSSFLRCIKEIERKTGQRFDRTVLVTEPLIKDRVEEYKAQRKEVLPTVAAAFQLALDILPHLDGFGYIFCDDVEADRVIAQLARAVTEWGDENDHVYICTSDKDLCQLVGEQVSCIRPEREWMVFGPKEVEARYKVPPEKLVLYLTLAGDKSDNIPNVPGWGEKFSAAAANQAADLEGLKHLTGFRPGLIKALHDNWESVVKHYGMIDLRDEEPRGWPGPNPDPAKVRELCRKTPALAWLTTPQFSSVQPS